MRFICLFIWLWVIGATAQGQQKELVGIQFDYAKTIDGYQPGVGPSLEAWFGDHFSVRYSFLYAPTGSNEYYLYTGGGQAAGFYLIRRAIRKRSGLDIGIPLGIIAFALPERYSFRIPLANNSQLAFFFEPYGFEFIKHTGTGEEDHEISFEIGCSYYLAAGKRIYIIPHLGIKQIYGDNNPGISFGASVMFGSGKSQEEPIKK
ncbi:hypothetical protein QQ020_13805 [Fulvivirgaceae bacterium BMA12]|uniref:Outer membrane protein beta-barrel domain-containing protein n=1 Tax=Agaribacillus aureus TaxID=3051825 RepID=A0ABT8L819_9BACT|nr:hypothetical protein [Fulvivirgaceae bacterium BMA12]